MRLGDPTCTWLRRWKRCSGWSVSLLCTSQEEEETSRLTHLGCQSLSSKLWRLDMRPHGKEAFMMAPPGGCMCLCLEPLSLVYPASLFPHISAWRTSPGTLPGPEPTSCAHHVEEPWLSMTTLAVWGLGSQVTEGASVEPPSVCGPMSSWVQRIIPSA